MVNQHLYPHGDPRCQKSLGQIWTTNLTKTFQSIPHRIIGICSHPEQFPIQQPTLSTNLDCSGKITCTITRTTSNYKRNFTCKSSNLVYAISCITCKQQYVGQMKTILRCFQGHYANTNKALRHMGETLGKPWY